MTDSKSQNNSIIEQITEEYSVYLDPKKETDHTCKIELRNVTFASCDKFNITEVYLRQNCKERQLDV